MKGVFFSIYHRTPNADCIDDVTACDVDLAEYDVRCSTRLPIDAWINGQRDPAKLVPGAPRSKMNY